jgi:hypothetical protein
MDWKNDWHIIGGIAIFIILSVWSFLKGSLNLVLPFLTTLIWFVVLSGIRILVQKKINKTLKIFIILVMIIPLIFALSKAHIGINCPFKEGYHSCDTLLGEELNQCWKTYSQTCWNFDCSSVGGSSLCGFEDWITGILFIPYLSHGFLIVGVPFLISLILIILSATKVLKEK